MASMVRLEDDGLVQPEMGQRATAAVAVALKAAVFAWVAAVVGEGGSAAVLVVWCERSSLSSPSSEW